MFTPFLRAPSRADAQVVARLRMFYHFPFPSPSLPTFISLLPRISYLHSTTKCEESLPETRKNCKNRFVNNKKMAPAPLKFCLTDLRSASPFLSACMEGVDTHLQLCVLSSLGSHSEFCLHSECNPALQQRLQKFLRHSYYRCLCIQLRFYLFPISVFKAFHFSPFSFTPAPPLQKHQIKNPSHRCYGKKLLKKEGGNGSNVSRF